jgi:hypothetical protein
MVRTLEDRRFKTPRLRRQVRGLWKQHLIFPQFEVGIQEGNYRHFCIPDGRIARGIRFCRRASLEGPC